jgi:hypothetical protein
MDNSVWVKLEHLTALRRRECGVSSGPPLHAPGFCRTIPASSQSGLRGVFMLKRISVFFVAVAGAMALSGCISVYEGRPSTCEGRGPSDPNWPYCTGEQPGGD